MMQATFFFLWFAATEIIDTLTMSMAHVMNGPNDDVLRATNEYLFSIELHNRMACDRSTKEKKKSILNRRKCVLTFGSAAMACFFSLLLHH